MRARGVGEVGRSRTRRASPVLHHVKGKNCYVRHCPRGVVLGTLHEAEEFIVRRSSGEGWCWGYSPNGAYRQYGWVNGKYLPDRAPLAAGRAVRRPPSGSRREPPGFAMRRPDGTWFREGSDSAEHATIVRPTTQYDNLGARRTELRTLMPTDRVGYRYVHRGRAWVMVTLNDADDSWGFVSWDDVDLPGVPRPA